MLRLNFFCAFLLLYILVKAFEGKAYADSIASDSLSSAAALSQQTERQYRVRWQQLLVPSALIGAGIWGVGNHWADNRDHEISDVVEDIPHKKTWVDDYMQYTPLLSVYALKVCGVKGRHNIKQVSLIALTSIIMMTAIVQPMKHTFKEWRPDGSSQNSFPSGHTATAFMGAEILRHEYWDVSPWIGGAGYAVAAVTGAARIWNNRHWLTDVLAGAGIGILSARIAYWLYPTITKHVFPKFWNAELSINPYYSPHEKGIALAVKF